MCMENENNKIECIFWLYILYSSKTKLTCEITLSITVTQFWETQQLNSDVTLNIADWECHTKMNN